ncbi:MAG: alkene reductase [Vulcanimicrobiaceae bacterium]
MSVHTPNADVLFTSIRTGAIDATNRIFMAPLTRSRAGDGDVPTDVNARYYAQRATAGLVIAEATQISPQGKGYAHTPGIYSDAQVAGWKNVTDAVHAAGGKMVLQLWHVGRISHPSLQPDGALPVAPSAVAFASQVYNDGGFVDCVIPRALRADELPRIVDDFRRGAKNAMAAGFDGVEVHAANGYLLDQFLKTKSNTRDDEYGGSVENRVRFPLAVMRGVCEEIGSARTGIRISPQTHFGDVDDANPAETVDHFVGCLNDLHLAYVHVIEGETGGSRDLPGVDYVALRKRIQAPYVANNGYDRKLAIDAIGAGRVDAVAFGVPFIANPDLVERFRSDAPLNTPDQSSFYGGDEHGYVDYPFLEMPANV